MPRSGIPLNELLDLVRMPECVLIGNVGCHSATLLDMERMVRRWNRNGGARLRPREMKRDRKSAGFRQVRDPVLECCWNGWFSVLLWLIPKIKNSEKCFFCHFGPNTKVVRLLSIQHGQRKQCSNKEALISN